MEPKVSICIPTYNQVDKLEILLDSIRIQTFRDFEVIVSDDSSTDDVKLLVNHYGDLQIRYFRNSPAKGSPENWNHAISLAKGDWIKIMHHDDYFVYPDSLNEFVKHGEEANLGIDFVFSATLLSYSDSEIKNKYLINQNLLKNLNKQPALLFERNLIGSPSVCMYKRNLNISFDKSLIWLVDIEFYSRVILKHSILYIDKTLVSTIISTEQLSERMRNNPDYELYELFYCFNKLSGKLDRLNKKIFKQRILYFIKFFNIESSAQLLKHTKEQKVPSFLSLYFLMRRINPKIAFSIFYRLNKYRPIEN